MSCGQVGCVGDCSVGCEFASSRRLRRRAAERAETPAPSGARPVSTAARIAASTGLPLGEVRAALRAGRTLEDLMPRPRRGAAA